MGITFYIKQNFLPSEVCRELRETSRKASGTAAGVVRAGINRLDDSVRRTTVLTLPPKASSRVRDPIVSNIPKFEEYFALHLQNCEEIQFLVYREGGYFRAHRDRNNTPNEPEYIRTRQVAVVLFLNDMNDPREGFGGGELLVYGEVNRCQRIVGKSGMLVAFPSDTIHEVTQVRWGERFTAVTFLH